MNYPFYIFFGLAPSIAWLLFFLRKDSHPEHNATIIRIFLYGMLAAVPTALIELGFAEKLKSAGLSPFLHQIIYIFFGIALVEELFKYLVVKKKILKHPELDEPTDVMIYMIVSALGFAALENLLILLPLANPFQFLETFVISGFRFIGATFLHALASGVLGYFMAMSFFRPKNKTKLLLAGFIASVSLHGLYDLSIIEISGGFKFIAPIIILMGLIVFVSLAFKKVEKLKSICKISE